MNQAVLQGDVGNLSLTGLAAFSKILSILSAEDVSPSAMIQMENLGSLFHISGEHARKVPDLLTRYSYTGLDRLGIYAGWRKGDAASLMANSAGGQAISLLSNCVFSLYSPSDSGEILQRLSSKVLSSEMAVSSISQLVSVSQLLHDKLQTLGFGNILAHEVTKIYTAYENFNKPVPSGFLNDIPTETMIELCYHLSQAFREQATLLRIRGSSGMGHILGILMLMFPEDTLVTLENLIIHQGSTSKSIILEFDNSGKNPEIHLESIIGGDRQETQLRIEVVSGDLMRYRHHYCFQWKGWIADLLQLAFVNVGLNCPEVIRRACCDVIVQLPLHMGNRSISAHDETSIPSTGYLGLLGQYPYERMKSICQELFRITDFTVSNRPLSEVYHALQSIAEKATTNLLCSCDSNKRCLSSPGWQEPRTKPSRDCRVNRIWNIIGSCIHYGFVCLFINAGDNATVIHPSPKMGVGSMAEFITEHLGNKYYEYWSCQSLHRRIMSTINVFGLDDVVARSNSSTLYLTAICTLTIPSQMAGQYNLVDGKLVFNGQYHKSITSAEVKSRPIAKKSLQSQTPAIVPCRSGEHDTILLTLRERLHALEMLAIAQVGGHHVHLNLYSVITSSWGLEVSEPCEHYIDSPLDQSRDNDVITTSVASPGTTQNKIAVVQVRGNPVAQLLSCYPGTTLLLQNECCLSCAVDQLEQIGAGYGTIICG